MFKLYLKSVIKANAPWYNNTKITNNDTIIGILKVHSHTIEKPELPERLRNLTRKSKNVNNDYYDKKWEQVFTEYIDWLIRTRCKVQLMEYIFQTGVVNLITLNFTDRDIYKELESMRVSIRLINIRQIGYVQMKF